MSSPTFLLATALLPLGCGSGAAPATRSTTSEPDEIVASWRELEPRLHAVYRGRLALGDGQACASELQRVVPAPGPTPLRLCTPLADVIAWHTGHAVALPTGPSLWIATTRTPAGVERVAAAVAAAPDASTIDSASGEALATQVRCGQLALRWQIPVSSQSCTTDSDCRTFTASCFAATVAVRDAAPYDELYRRWGGTCDDPSGGACLPPGPARCVASRCTFTE